MADDKLTAKADLIWAIADKLTGVYKPHEYGLVILPLTVLKRFDSILSDTKQKVIETYEKNKDKPIQDNYKAEMLCSASGHRFYNTSKYTFDSVIGDADNIEKNFNNYLDGFSANIQDIIDKFKFRAQVELMAKKRILFEVIKEFTSPKANLHPDVVSNIEMGYIFEEIVRRFSESHNEDAGQHYTPREVIQLMCALLFIDDELTSGEGEVRTVYDPACGTGGMLSEAQEYVGRLNNTARLTCFGQEINDETFAICKADMLIKGQDADNVRCENTLSCDMFPGEKFDYILSNPPFGREWKNERSDVEREAGLGMSGRFGPGLPPVSDSQMLFLLNCVSKMKSKEDGGSRVAIIHNGSPLFSGDAGSGPSEIRKYLCEHDILDTIVALPNDIFYNTGIATYIWILDNNKPESRKGKVQLINANQMFEKRRKALGNKRNDIPKSAVEDIVRCYRAFEESEISKVFETTEFGYTKITVERPLYDENGKVIKDRKGQIKANSELRDTENIPLNEDIQEYFEREVLPYAEDAYIDENKTVIGYEIPFTRYFYKYVPPRPSEEIKKEILALEEEMKNCLKEIFE